MAASGVLKLASLMLMLYMVVISAPQMAKAAVTCSDVVNHLMPCVSYVSNGGPLPEACCNGIKALYGEARTAGDRQDVCKCLESAVKGITYSRISLGLAEGLPDKCGLHLPYKISPSTDCSKVS